MLKELLQTRGVVIESRAHQGMAASHNGRAHGSLVPDVELANRRVAVCVMCIRACMTLEIVRI